MKHKTLLLTFLSAAAFAVGCNKEETTSQQLDKVQGKTEAALEARLPEDQIPPGQMYFSNISADQILRHYTNLNWKKVEVKGRIESISNIGLIYTNRNSMTRAEAISALEQVFREQAGIEVSLPDDSRVILKLRE